MTDGESSRFMAGVVLGSRGFIDEGYEPENFAGGLTLIRLPSTKITVVET